MQIITLDDDLALWLKEIMRVVSDAAWARYIASNRTNETCLAHKDRAQSLIEALMGSHAAVFPKADLTFLRSLCDETIPV
jgi:hypothetical protein